jgi:hypothetical protein
MQRLISSVSSSEKNSVVWGGGRPGWNWCEKNGSCTTRRGIAADEVEKKRMDGVRVDGMLSKCHGSDGVGLGRRKGEDFLTARRETKESCDV